MAGARRTEALSRVVACCAPFGRWQQHRRVQVQLHIVACCAAVGRRMQIQFHQHGLARSCTAGHQVVCGSVCTLRSILTKYESVCLCCRARAMALFRAMRHSSIWPEPIRSAPRLVYSPMCCWDEVNRMAALHMHFQLRRIITVTCRHSEIASDLPSTWNFQALLTTNAACVC